MPESAQPGKVLRAGEFYSPVQSRLSANDVVLSELRQPCERLVPRHEHELAYVTVVLHGDYLEGDRGKLDELRPFTAVFNPAGTAHSTIIGPSGASFFTVELRAGNLRHLGIGLPRPEPPSAANKSLPAAEIDMEARGAAAGERRAHG